MAFRRPSLRKRRGEKSPAVVSTPSLVPADSIGAARRPYGMPHLKIMDQIDLQDPQGAYVQKLPNILAAQSDNAQGGGEVSFNTPAEPVSPSKAANKKDRQWRRWANEVIPALLAPYLTVLHESGSLRNLEPATEACPCSASKVEVVCVYFERLVTRRVCTCAAPLHLLRLGLFPCSPLRPTLAVDLNMLEYVQELFLHSSPNVTAWSDTLEAFLGTRDYKLRNKDGLRRRFGNALHWYSNLVNRKDLLVRSAIEKARNEVLEGGKVIIQDLHVMLIDYIEEINLPPTSPSLSSDGEHDLPPTTSPTTSVADPQDHPDDDFEPTKGELPQDPRSRYKARVEDDIEDEYDEMINEKISDFLQSSDDNLSRPSEYLRNRCPLCFGGKCDRDSDTLADVIVCIDACFTQKRRTPAKGSGRGPANTHPASVFVSDPEVKAMKDYVENARPTRSAKKSADAPDGFEPSMKVPTSALDGCQDSFLAADERRMKASTKYFADTGLMALLCRHDRVLWLVNMTSAGERQYYALALLEKLFDNLPKEMTVGVLYDIGCQLHRSCEKWNFLERYRDRIIWGISVFHAYGHQWACQLIYHPRKCKGFGLSDGEGCERFWSSIKLLIPSLRVSGYYKRLYAIDAQVKFLDEKSLLNLGKWLLRKWSACQSRQQEALLILETLGIAMEILKQQWANQIHVQTQPLTKQSKNLGSKAVKEVIALNAAKSALTKELEKLDRMLLSGDYEDEMEIEDVLALRTDINDKISKMSSAIAQKKKILGVEDRANLKKLVKNKFLQARMNARALKQRIRSRLRERKFELERLERAYRHTVSNEKKLHDHVSSQVKRHEPGILQLCKKYNDLCADMTRQITRGEAPAGAVAPLTLEKDGLFKLDVDDDIWQDIGLNDEDDSGNGVPEWLANEKMRQGIKAMLEVDRCEEEQQRLKKERCAMQEWMLEEWVSVEKAISDCIHNSDLTYQLLLHQNYLLKLCALWQPLVVNIPGIYELSNDWGPSNDQILEAIKNEATASYDEETEKEEEEEEEEEEYGQANEHEDLWDAMEMTSFADAYRLEASLTGVWDIPDVFDEVDVFASRGPSRSQSPRKKGRATTEIVFAGASGSQKRKLESDNE
ncbi:hypothetical protein Hypma_005865 [Hypsizygus marmoreus]|uniref:CxC1-like cysteine cluster associated with KDZ transposases domain-containing protein n=1 Tax=Hypsizygus marmoreus TaxID=39966 RepID=A0A369KD27_HYPMA|nr:hypothetical protein Hypma_005865 [Hypsizygus marmoreus]